MNGQQNTNLNMDNLIPADAQQVVPQQNENDLHMLAMAAAQQQEQEQGNQLPPEPLGGGYRIIYNMDDFVSSAIETLQGIVTVYGHEHDNYFYSRESWYSCLDELFDQMSRMVLGHRDMWQGIQYMRDILRPVFMAPDRWGRHIDQEQAQQLLDAFIHFRDQ